MTDLFLVVLGERKSSQKIQKKIQHNVLLLERTEGPCCMSIMQQLIMLVKLALIYFVFVPRI